MPTMMRHIGRVKSTGSRVALIWLQLPDAPQKCLVAQLDSLPEYYKATVGKILESDEGQNAVELYAVLNRRKAEGANISLLEALHRGGHLAALPVENIEMLPLPSQAIPLTAVLKSMGRIVPRGVAETQHEYAQPRKMTAFEENQQADLEKNRRQIAQNKINQAKILEEEARKFRLEAYSLVPELAPVTEVASDVAAETDQEQSFELFDVANATVQTEEAPNNFGIDFAEDTPPSDV